MLYPIGKRGGKVGLLERLDGFRYFRFSVTSATTTEQPLCRRSSDNIYPFKLIGSGLVDLEINLTYTWYNAQAAAGYTRDRRYYLLDAIYSIGSVTFGDNCGAPVIGSKSTTVAISTTSTSGTGICRVSQFDGLNCNSPYKKMSGLLKINETGLRGFGSNVTGNFEYEEL